MNELTTNAFSTFTRRSLFNRHTPRAKEIRRRRVINVLNPSTLHLSIRKKAIDPVVQFQNPNVYLNFTVEHPLNHNLVSRLIPFPHCVL